MDGSRQKAVNAIKEKYPHATDLTPTSLIRSSRGVVVPVEYKLSGVDQRSYVFIDSSENVTLYREDEDLIRFIFTTPFMPKTIAIRETINLFKSPAVVIGLTALIITITICVIYLVNYRVSNFEMPGSLIQVWFALVGFYTGTRISKE